MTRTTIRLVKAAVAVAVLGLTACGDNTTSDKTTAGNQSEPRTIEIEMRDIAFSPNQIDVKAGETVRFIFTNAGTVTHDAFIGDEAAQEGHEMEMRDMVGMDGMDGMGDEDGIAVEPGESGEITHTFAEGGQIIIGCHEAGHYAAGMKVVVNLNG